VAAVRVCFSSVSTSRSAMPVMEIVESSGGRRTPLATASSQLP
jgi:hypothetical protein